jgi:hypothetical protein
MTLFAIKLGVMMTKRVRSVFALFLTVLLVSIFSSADVNDDLRAAASAGNILKVKELISKGADVNAKSPAWFTPLLNAIIGGHRAVAELLIEKGADVNAQFSDYRTPLMFAAKQGDTELAKLLIRKGAKVNAKSYDGETALSIAEKAGKTSMVALLKQSGASPTLALAPDEVIFQLQPPATEEEATMYRKLKTESPGEVLPFIATRKFFRQLRAQFPDGKVDWKKAPRPPVGIKSEYALDFDEQITYLQMLVAYGMNSK